MNEVVWSEKYRPRKVADVILPAVIKSQFQEFVNQRNLPNLLLWGGSGIGKTTAAKAVLEEIDCDYILLNGSLDRGIDILREDVTNFASTVSLRGTRKYVIFDEADNLNPLSTQPALRGFMDDFSVNCGFIFTCNFRRRIIEALHSRCSVIGFAVPKEEFPAIAASFAKKAFSILDQEKIKYDKIAVMELVKKYFPDFRRVLNELQRYSVNGTIDKGILNTAIEGTYMQLFKAMKDKDFRAVRTWAGEHSDIDAPTLFREFYNNSDGLFKKESIPSLVVLIGEYQYKAAFVADAEINTSAFLANVMAECAFL